VYRLAALAMLGGWAFEYVEPVWRVAFFAGGGAGLILIGAVTRSRERAMAGAVFAFAGLALFWTRFGHGIAWQELPAILAIPLSLRIGRRLCGDRSLLTEVRNLLVAAAMASVWLWVTRWTTWHGDSSRLTAMWGMLALAVFAAGLGLRERMYRIGGFAILALAVARLFFVDVWRFDSLGRILSFLVLGGVLLTLSFVYHRFAEAMRRWL
jgi:MFS family permease